MLNQAYHKHFSALECNQKALKKTEALLRLWGLGLFFNIRKISYLSIFVSLENV